MLLKKMSKEWKTREQRVSDVEERRKMATVI